MGRIKRGLDYFPMSTSFMHDRMVRRIMRREGDSAFATLVETLSYIYAGKGYYISVGDEFYEELVDSLYSTELDDVKRIISLSVEYGLFDVGLFRQYNILTSADIQRQYLFITKRRSSALIEPDYCLLESEEITSYRSSQSGKSSTDDSLDSECAEALNGDADHKTATDQNADAGHGLEQKMVQLFDVHRSLSRLLRLRRSRRGRWVRHWCCQYTMTCREVAYFSSSTYLSLIHISEPTRH